MAFKVISGGLIETPDETSIPNPTPRRVANLRKSQKTIRRLLTREPEPEPSAFKIISGGLKQPTFLESVKPRVPTLGEPAILTPEEERSARESISLIPTAKEFFQFDYKGKQQVSPPKEVEAIGEGLRRFGYSTLDTLLFNVPSLTAKATGLPISEPKTTIGKAGEVVGTVAGSIGRLKAISGFIGKTGLAGKTFDIGNKLSPYWKAAPRFLPRIIHTGATFGGVTFIENAIKQGFEGKIDILDLGEKTIKDTALGGSLGFIGGFKNVPVAVVSAGGLGYLASKSEGASEKEALINGAVWAGFELFGAAGREKALRAGAEKSIRDSLAQWAKARNDRMSTVQAKEMADIYFAQLKSSGMLDKVLVDGKLDVVNVMESFNANIQASIKGVKPIPIRGEFIAGAKPPVTPAPAKLPVKPPTAPPAITPAPAGVVEKPIAKKFTAEQPKPPAKPLTPEEEGYKKIIEASGGEFVGVTTAPAGIWFNEPIKGSTLVLKPEDFSKEAIQAKFDKFKALDEKAKKAKPEVKEKPSLVEEARKYDKVEDFVAGQVKFYHGTVTGDFSEFSKEYMGKRTGAPSAKKAIFFSKNKKVAETYSEIIEDKTNTELLDLFEFGDLKSDDPFENIPKKGQIIEASLDMKKPYVWDFKGTEIREESFRNLIEKAIKQGYDSVIFKNVLDTYGRKVNKIYDDIYAVFNPSQIKTKSQLTAIWNEAQKGKVGVKPVSFDDMITIKGEFETKLKLDRSLSAYGAIVKPENVYNAIKGYSPAQLKALSNWYKMRENPAQLMVSGMIDSIIEKPPQKPALTAEEKRVEKPVEKIPEKPKISRVTVEELEKSREKYGLAELSVDESKKWVDIFSKASTKTFESTSISNSIHKKARVLTNEEFAILSLRKAELENIINEAEENAGKAIDSGNKVEQERYSGVSATALSELDTITESLRFSNREAGRALNIIKVAIKKEQEQYKIAKILLKAKVAKGKTLTTEEINKFRELAKKIKVFEQKESDLNKQIETLEEQLSKKDAEQNFVKTVKGKARKVKTEDLSKERESLFEQLNKIGYRLNDITGVTYESAKIISQLSINYFQSGIKSVEKIAEEITNKLPGVTKKDVYDSLGGRIKRTKAIVVSDTKRQILELKKQAKLLGEIEDAYNGIFAKLAKGPISSGRVASLRKQLKELKNKAEISTRDEERLKEILMKIDSINDQLDSGIKLAAKKKVKVDPKKIQEAKTKLHELRRLLNLRDTISKLEKQIRTGKKETVKGVRVDTVAIKQAKSKIVELRREIHKKERVQNLKGKIAELEKQLETGARTEKVKRFEDTYTKNIKQDISEIRRLIAAKDKIADLEKQLETGDFKVPVRVQRVVKRADLLEAQVKLSQLRREVREHIHRLRPRTGREVFVDIVSLPRELMATADFSAVGRQAAVLSALNPIKTLKILKQSLPAFFKQDKADEIDVLIKQHENHETRIKAGLKIKSMENIKFSDREEYFLSSLGEKIPLYGHVVRASNRHMVSHLNLMRVMAFDRFLDLYPDSTDAELKNWASYVNIASGIGDMGSFNKVASELSVAFFSPRFSTSRIQMPYEVFKYRKTPRVRKEIAKNYMKFLSIVGLTLWLAKLAGADIELDPEDPDWLKIQIGDTRIDPWGGLQQPARVTVLSAMKTLSTFGVIKMKKNIDLYNAMARFIRYKLSPAVSAPLELAQGKSAIGEEVTPIQTFTRIVTPLAAEEVVETFRSNALLGAILSPFIMLGVGVATYEDRRKKAPTEPTYYERPKSRKVEKFYETVEKRKKKASWL